MTRFHGNQLEQVFRVSRVWKTILQAFFFLAWLMIIMYIIMANSFLLQNLLYIIIIIIPHQANQTDIISSSSSSILLSTFHDLGVQRESGKVEEIICVCGVIETLICVCRVIETFVECLLLLVCLLNPSLLPFFSSPLYSPLTSVQFVAMQITQSSILVLQNQNQNQIIF
jgi:hypothetical protein